MTYTAETRRALFQNTEVSETVEKRILRKIKGNALRNRIRSGETGRLYN